MTQETSVNGGTGARATATTGNLELGASTATSSCIKGVYQMKR